MLTLSQGLFSLFHCPACEEAGGAKNDRRGQNQDSWPKLAKGIFQNIWQKNRGIGQRQWWCSIAEQWAVGGDQLCCASLFFFFVILLLLLFWLFYLPFLSYQTTSAYEFYFFSNSLSYLTAGRSEQTLVWCLSTCHRSQSCKLTQRKKLSAMQAQTSTASSPFSPLADQDKGLLTETIYSVNPSSSWPWTHRLFRSWP